jgi:hypothetical protein
MQGRRIKPRSFFTSPRLRGEVEAEAQRRLRVRGTLHALGLAESPPHPDRICRCDPTSPRKRGEVI